MYRALDKATLVIIVTLIRRQGDNEHGKKQMKTSGPTTHVNAFAMVVLLRFTNVFFKTGAFMVIKTAQHVASFIYTEFCFQKC